MRFISFDYLANDFLCVQDTPVTGDLQCVRALWMPNTTSDGKKRRT